MKSSAELKSTSFGEDGSVSLQGNVKSMLIYTKGDRSRRNSDEGQVSNDSSISSLDETLRCDMSKSATATVKEWGGSELQKLMKNTVLSDKVPLRVVAGLQPSGITQETSVMTSDVSNYEEEKSSFHDSHRPAVSTDESLHIGKPQPHVEDGCHLGNFGACEPEEQLSAVLRKYQYPRKHAWASKQARHTSHLFMRMSRQIRYGTRGSLPSPRRRNRIKLHVYDLIPVETVMQLPWGCMIPIGKCFDLVNSSLHSMGTGAYHVGVEVNGVEYSFGACDVPGHTGVFSCMPKRSPGYQYRTTIDFGERALVKKAWVSEEEIMGSKKDGLTPTYREVEQHIDGCEVIKEMAAEYPGIAYDLLRKNCVTFACDACLRLGVDEKEIPSYFRNLCESGALTQDVALQTVEPIQNIFSVCEDYGDIAEKTIEDGFEVITKVDGRGLKQDVTVIDAVECNQYQCTDCPSLGVPTTLSWTY